MGGAGRFGDLDQLGLIRSTRRHLLPRFGDPWTLAAVDNTAIASVRLARLAAAVAAPLTLATGVWPLLQELRVEPIEVVLEIPQVPLHEALKLGPAHPPVAVQHERDREFVKEERLLTGAPAKRLEEGCPLAAVGDRKSNV